MLGFKRRARYCEFGPLLVEKPITIAGNNATDRQQKPQLSACSAREKNQRFRSAGKKMAPKSKDKPKPSPSSQPPPPIEDQFTSLNRHIQRSEFSQAVKVADQSQSSFIEHFVAFLFTSQTSLVFPSCYSHLLNYLIVLSIAPGDDDALRCKIVALIKDDRIDNALSAIQSSQTADFSFFKVEGVLRIMFIFIPWLF